MANPQTGNGFTKIAKPEIIETLSREGVELRQRGRISWACCPLHQERTPSFCVDREKQRFKCFGCGVGGDVVDFVMKHKGLAFPEALVYLGISGSAGQSNPQETQMRELTEKFKEWCCNYTKYLCERLRWCNRIDSIVKAPDDLELKGLGEMYMMRDIYQYHLSVLESKNDELKFQMYKEVSNGR